MSSPSPKTEAGTGFVSPYLKMAYILCLIGGIGVAIVYAFQGFYSEFMYDFSNVAPPFIAGVAVASSFFALRRYWDYFGSRLSMIWLSFALGMLLWFLGEVGWAYYTMVVGIEVPYPSIADVFWLAGYLPLFLALLLYVELFQPAISVRLFLLAGAIVGIVSALVFSSLMIPVLASASELDFVTLGISLAYTGLDLLLFLEAVLGLLVFTVTKLKGRLGKAWHFMNAAIFLTTLADMSFSYTTLDGSYFNGHPLEMLYHASYLLFALAFFVHSKEL